MNVERFRNLVEEIKKQNDGEVFVYNLDYIGDYFEYPQDNYKSLKLPHDITSVDLFLKKHIRNISLIQYRELENKYKIMGFNPKYSHHNKDVNVIYISIQEFYNFLFENKLF
jgi:hypothetical protein